MTESTLGRPEASAAVEAIGWRLVLGNYAASVPARTLAHAVEIAAAITEVAGDDAAGHLRVDLRPDRVELFVQTAAVAGLTRRDVELAHGITDAVRDLGLDLAPPVTVGSRRPVQLLELAIDAMDIPAIRPFWKAVMAYTDELGRDGPDDAIIDPVWQGPSIWFQQMDAPRPQRNRIHFDITVSHDEAQRRVQAAIDAGGVLVSDEAARSFWILADVEGNEVCVCTWQDRER